MKMNIKTSESVKSTIIKNSHINLSAKLLELEAAGYSFIELTLVVSIIGILAAIAAPAWLGFINNERLRTSNNRIYQVIKIARSNAMRDKSTWQASFQQEQDKTAKWAVHPATVDPQTANWENLNPSVQIDDETTLYQYPPSKYPSTNIWRMQFNYKGNTNGQLGRITLSLRSGGTAKRCVFVSTLLGAMRTAKDQAQPKGGKYCY